MSVLNEGRRESRLRALAKRQGLEVCKSRVRKSHLDDHGGFRIVDPYFNIIEAGERFDLDLDDVERFLTE